MENRKKLPILKVNQWLDSWENAHWKPEENLPEPKHYFYVGSMPIQDLRKLAGVTERKTELRANHNVPQGYQRAHEDRRSKNIARYIKYGYPLSTQKNLDTDTHNQLINPGWLPNAIIINIIPNGETRYKYGSKISVADHHLVKVCDESSISYIDYPEDPTLRDADGTPSLLEPVEIIDGQHRLYAIDELRNLEGEYEVPVVIFDGLELGWQAYLFWMINVAPKKINPSLAFDLYPELRRQEWLEQGEAIRVYQEHRAQELTEILWRHPSSPWKDRIELHGKRVKGHVSNAAFIRSLMSSFVRKWGSQNSIGGLFGSISNSDGSSSRVLPWKRSQQAAFLIFIWRHLYESVNNSNAEWVKPLRQNTQRTIDTHQLDPAFAGEFSLLSTDQGVRAILVVFNALCQANYDELGLENWISDDVSDNPDENDVEECLQALRKQEILSSFIRKCADEIVNGIDWRTSSEPSLDKDQNLKQSAYRGSSGYKMLKDTVFDCLSKSKDIGIKEAAIKASNMTR